MLINKLTEGGGENGDDGKMEMTLNKAQVVVFETEYKEGNRV